MPWVLLGTKAAASEPGNSASWKCPRRQEFPLVPQRNQWLCAACEALLRAPYRAWPVLVPASALRAACIPPPGSQLRDWPPRTWHESSRVRNDRQISSPAPASGTQRAKPHIGLVSQEQNHSRLTYFALKTQKHSATFQLPSSIVHPHCAVSERRSRLYFPRNGASRLPRRSGGGVCPSRRFSWSQLVDFATSLLGIPEAAAL